MNALFVHCSSTNDSGHLKAALQLARDEGLSYFCEEDEYTTRPDDEFLHWIIHVPNDRVIEFAGKIPVEWMHEFDVMVDMFDEDKNAVIDELQDMGFLEATEG